MNAEAQKVVQELEAYSKTVKSMSLHDTTQANAFLAFETSRLQTILADDQAKSSERLENHTRVLLDLGKTLLNETKLLRWLTVGLFILTAGLLVFTVCLVIRH